MAHTLNKEQPRRDNYQVSGESRREYEARVSRLNRARGQKKITLQQTDKLAASIFASFFGKAVQ